MSPKKATSASPRRSVVLTKGDWLDVMDHDGVWNVARVLSVPSPEEVQVMYDGWPEEYDEVVRVDSDRVAPFHTYTWAVKCWVKYLNWPIWPSVITIRTPGNEEGIENLAMENRLYVDFLEAPDFAQRDRCWQKKREVKIFDDNYDRNRMGTNGAQFERALENVLKSDATTKMPKFARGTLPLQYDNLTTEPVEAMRKHMGKGLWYRNFANNKERHMHTHIYDVVGDEDEELSGNESDTVEKLKVKRPRTSAAEDDRIVSRSQKKKKRPLPAEREKVSVKVEQESPSEVEVPYEFEPIHSSESEPEKEAVLAKKKRRVQGKSRSTPPVEGITRRKQEKRVVSPEYSNVAPSMPRHVTVMMDEIIVDDDSDRGSSDRRKVTKKTRTPPRRTNNVKSVPPRMKEESGNVVSFSEPETVSLRSSRSSTRTRQRVRRRKSEGAATLHRDTWDGMFSGAKSATPRSKITGLSISSDDEDDDSGYSDSFDPGTTSEDKAESPFDSRISSQETVEAFVADTASPPHHAKPKTDKSSLGPTKIKGRGKAGNPKMAARRSIPHVSEDLSLTASAKPRHARSGRVLSDDDEEDSEDEKKGVLHTAIKAQAQEELAVKKSIARHHDNPLKKSKNNEDAAASMKSRQSKPSKRSKVPVSLIEQRIASAHEALRLDKEKLQTTEAVTGPDQRKRASPTAPNSSVKSRSRMLRADEKETPLHEGQASDGPFFRVAGRGHGLAKLSGDGDRQVGRVVKNPPDLELRSDQLGHSFLSVNEAYSSEGQESKHVPTPFDDDIDIRAEPKVSPKMGKADAKVKGGISGDSKQAAEKKGGSNEWEEETYHEVRRHVCVMSAGLEDALEMERDETIETPKTAKTVISVPRKFDEQAATRVFTSPTDSMLRVSSPPGDQSEESITSPSPEAFSSSGFSMEKWFQRTVISSFRGAKT